MERITHWIDGATWQGPTGRTAPVHDPATGAVTGQVDLADADVVAAAVASASRAAADWRTSSLSQRTKVLFRFRELLAARAYDVAVLITAEHGKVLL